MKKLFPILFLIICLFFISNSSEAKIIVREEYFKNDVIEMTIPVIENDEYPEAAEKINTLINNYFPSPETVEGINYINELKKKHHKRKSYYFMSFINNNLLCIKLISSYNLGGPYWYEVFKIYTIDMQRNKIYELFDLFKEPEIANKILYSHIETIISFYKDNNDKKNKHRDYEDKGKEYRHLYNHAKLHEADFYFTPDEFVLFFNIYKISSREIKFPIDLIDIKHLFINEIQEKLY
jgi:HAMP domain-containing protein